MLLLVVLMVSFKRQEKSSCTSRWEKFVKSAIFGPAKSMKPMKVLYIFGEAEDENTANLLKGGFLDWSG